MTFYFYEINWIAAFEENPQHNVNADAKLWSPYDETWKHCPGSTGIGADVLWSGDYYPIPESAVPLMQQRLRESMARWEAAKAAEAAEDARKRRLREAAGPS